MPPKQDANEINAVTDMTGLPVIGVTRARARASRGDRGEPVISVTGAENRHFSILAVDLGTATGWALLLPDGCIVSGTVSFRPGRYEGGGMRYLRFRSWLDELVGRVPGMSAVYFEEVRRHAGTDAAHIYGGFLAHLAAWCEQRQLPYQGVPVSVIKRHATGKGNAGKDAVIAAMKAKGHQPADDNEADALAILHWALAEGGGR